MALFDIQLVPGNDCEVSIVPATGTGSTFVTGLTVTCVVCLSPTSTAPIGAMSYTAVEETARYVVIIRGADITSNLTAYIDQGVTIFVKDASGTFAGYLTAVVRAVRRLDLG